MSDPVITLIAIGNRNRGDDGIGIAILESIESQLSIDIDVHYWEDSDALSVAAQLLEINNPIVIIDCADMGLSSGEYRWFNSSECLLSQHLNELSTHGFGFSDALKLAQAIGFQQFIFFFAIQPEQLDYYSGISPVLQQQLKRLGDALLNQLAQLRRQLAVLAPELKAAIE